jgi:flagellar biosynthesis protein FlhF
MRIRKFQADTIREALLQVKDEMGPEALILRTQKIKGSFLGGGERYEVTAGLEEKFEAQARQPAEAMATSSGSATAASYGPGSKASGVASARVPGPVRPSETTGITRDEYVALQQGIDAVRKAAESPRDDIAAVRREMGQMRSVLSMLADSWKDQAGVRISESLLPYYQRMLASDLAEPIAQKACEETQRRLEAGALLDDPEWARSVLLQVLAEILPCAPVLVPRGHGPKVLLFAGPTGVGKTTTIMKLAARLSAQGALRVGLVSCDSYRIGAQEQIRTFAEVAGIPLRTVFTDEDIQRSVKELHLCDVILVDTAGRSPRNQMHRMELAALAERLKPDEIHLVQSATTRLRDLRLALSAYKDIGPNRLVFTKLDETDSYGALCTLMAEENIPASILCFGQDIPEHMGDAAPEELARMILGEDDGRSA